MAVQEVSGKELNFQLTPSKFSSQEIHDFFFLLFPYCLRSLFLSVIELTAASAA